MRIFFLNKSFDVLSINLFWIWVVLFVFIENDFLAFLIILFFSLVSSLINFHYVEHALRLHANTGTLTSNTH